MSITEIIKPIQLLAGHHESISQTGSGCFMDVVAYLNGEPQITDSSPCVCVTVRPLAIRLNDRAASDEQRQRMIPFVMRAMGSATKDRAVFDERMRTLRAYGAECQDLINAWREVMKVANANAYADADAYAYAYAYAYADAYAYANADAYAYAYANAYAYADAYAYANANAKSKTDELKQALFDAGLRYLDAVLPPAQEADAVVIGRATALRELACS